VQQARSQRRFADFFAGIGLMRMGLERAGWEVAFANDISREKFEMYSGHFDDAAGHYVVDDVANIRADDVPDIELATASFPCTDLSLAGGRKGLSGSQSSAYWDLVKILEDMGVRRPPLVLLENVSGLLSSHGGRDFEAALLALNNLDYLVDPIIVDASAFVPQSREAIRCGEAAFDCPMRRSQELRLLPERCPSSVACGLRVSTPQHPLGNREPSEPSLPDGRSAEHP